MFIDAYSFEYFRAELCVTDNWRKHRLQISIRKMNTRNVSDATATTKAKSTTTTTRKKATKWLWTWHAYWTGVCFSTLALCMKYWWMNHSKVCDSFNMIKIQTLIIFFIYFLCNVIVSECRLAFFFRFVVIQFLIAENCVLSIWYRFQNSMKIIKFK